MPSPTYDRPSHPLFRKAISVALAVSFATLGLVFGVAEAHAQEQAEKTHVKATDEAKPATKPATKKKPGKHKKKAQAHKAHAGNGGKAKSAPRAALPKAQKTKKHSGRETKPAPKHDKAEAKGSDSSAPRSRCEGARVTLDRAGLAEVHLALVDCHGAPLARARRTLATLARPWGMAAASAPGTPPLPSIDEGLIPRLDAVARRFPGRTISLVSGARPSSKGSAHQTGRALDLRVESIDNAALAAFCRTLIDTGCGFYPNSSFVHMDVRAPGAGSISWIDASGPGEPPRYVSAWPPPSPTKSPP